MLSRSEACTKDGSRFGERFSGERSHLARSAIETVSAR